MCAFSLLIVVSSILELNNIRWVKVGVVCFGLHCNHRSVNKSWHQQYLVSFLVFTVSLCGHM